MLPAAVRAQIIARPLLGEVIVGTTGASSWPPPTTYDVRELANVIERAVVLGQGPRIALNDLSPRIVAARSESRSEPISYRDAMDAYRRQLVMSALAETHGNRAAAARVLGLHEKYLLRLLKSLRITE